MKRHIVNIITALSLLICVTALIAWLRSLLGETILIGSIPGAFAVGSWEASREFLHHLFGATTSDGHALHGLSLTGDIEYRWLGFAYVSGNRNGAEYWLVAVPYWLIVPLTAILPVRWWLLRRRRRQRTMTGRCLDCGYDLRGSPQCCPECGAAAPVAPAPVSPS